MALDLDSEKFQSFSHREELNTSVLRGLGNKGVRFRAGGGMRERNKGGGEREEERGGGGRERERRQKGGNE